MWMKKVFRSSAAIAMAACVLAAPMGVYAGETDETELMADLEDTLEEISAVPYEAGLSMEFGDGLYDLTAQSGQDSTWLKTLDGSFKVAQGDEMLNSEVSVSVNDTQLGHVLVSVDTVTGMIYVSIPEYLEQTAAISPQQLMDSVMDGSAFTTSGDSYSMQGQIIKMLFGMGADVAEQFAEFFRSVPAEVWQQEMMNYLMPVMSSVQSDSTQEEMTVGSMSADVQTQTYTIPSEQMGGVIKSILDTLAQDELIESLLQSEAVSNLSSLVSMVSGESAGLSGQDLLDQFHSVVENAASADFSGVPGIAVSISQSADGRAKGAQLSLEADGMTYEMLTCKAIAEGGEHAFEVTPGAMLLSMSSQSDVSSLSLQGQGSTAGGVLNEDVELMVNGEAAAKLTVTDLEGSEAGSLNGTIRLEAGGVAADIIYAAGDDGAQTIEYRVNDKVFYNAQLYQGPAEDGSIEAIDLANLIPVNSIQDVQEWFGTFDAQTAQELLSEAGIPMQEEAPAA